LIERTYQKPTKKRGKHWDRFKKWFGRGGGGLQDTKRGKKSSGVTMARAKQGGKGGHKRLGCKGVEGRGKKKQRRGGAFGGPLTWVPRPTDSDPKREYFAQESVPQIPARAGKRRALAKKQKPKGGPGLKRARPPEEGGGEKGIARPQGVIA